MNIRTFKNRSTVTIRAGALTPTGDQIKNKTRAKVDLNGEPESKTLWVQVIPISGPQMGNPIHIHNSDLSY